MNLFEADFFRRHLASIKDICAISRLKKYRNKNKKRIKKKKIILLTSFHKLQQQYQQ
uniref:Uncharacterized protein n=1 Tax=Octopus bimaculoides TaxID=37653 RepID=A0A0L8FZL5_OCTBM